MTSRTPDPDGKPKGRGIDDISHRRFTVSGVEYLQV